MRNNASPFLLNSQFDFETVGLKYSTICKSLLGGTRPESGLSSNHVMWLCEILIQDDEYLDIHRLG